MRNCIDCGKILTGGSKPIRCKVCCCKGILNPFYGKKHTKKTGLKISASLLGKTGILSRNWKGGIQSDRNYLNNKAKKWRLKNPEKQRLIQQRRLALHKKAGILTLKTIQEVYEDNIKLYGTMTCVYCLLPIVFGQDTLEHKIPLNKDETHEKSNLAIACKHCNCSKADKLPEEFSERFRPQRGNS